MPIFTDYVGQKTIDDEIAQHEVAIQSLKYQRNLLSAINRLPGEILALIFIENRLEMTAKGAWLPLLHICQRWRDIVLGTPSFWSTISLIDSPFVSTMIECSKTLPLTLEFPFHQLEGTEAFWEATDALLREGRRVRRITMSMSSSPDDGYLQSEVISHMESFELLLHTLKLQSIGNVHFSLPTSIWSSNSDFTHFRCLELSQVIFPLDDMPNLPSLTTLIVDYNPDSFNGLSLEWIIQFLRHTENIEEIELEWISSGNSITSSEPLMIPLSKLRRLYVASHTLLGSKLLEHLKLPSTTTIELDYSSLQNASIGFSSLEKVLCEIASGSALKSPELLTLVMDNSNQLMLGLFPQWNPVPPPPLRLIFPLVASEMQLYVQLLSKLPWTATPMLAFCVDLDPPPIVFRCQLLEIPVNAWKGCSSSFMSLAALVLDKVLIPADVADIPFFPSLYKLLVREMPAKTLSLNWIVQFLRNAPMINAIMLDTVSSVDPTEVAGPLPLQVDELATITIKSDSIAEAKIFEYLSLPVLTSVRAEYPSASACQDHTVDFSRFERLVTQICSAPHPALNEMSIIVSETEGAFTLAVSSLTKHPNESLLKLSLPFLVSSIQGFVSLVSRVPPQIINKLSITGVHSSALASQWSPLICLYSDITELTIDGNAQFIPQILWQALSDEANSSYSNPRLRTITTGPGCWIEGEGSNRVEMTDSWKNLFKRRRDIGLPIDRFVVKDDSVEQASLDCLKEYVEVTRLRV
ncbi:hypothetical protein ONZ45_g7734 [Pleurotus djamor]|nr:hypothetical protein ONZ45_g7734 [Pleurotus djamor]